APVEPCGLAAEPCSTFRDKIFRRWESGGVWVGGRRTRRVEKKIGQCCRCRRRPLHRKQPGTKQRQRQEACLVYETFGQITRAGSSSTRHVTIMPRTTTRRGLSATVQILK